MEYRETILDTKRKTVREVSLWRFLVGVMYYRCISATKRNLRIVPSINRILYESQPLLQPHHLVLCTQLPPLQDLVHS